MIAHRFVPVCRIHVVRWLSVWVLPVAPTNSQLFSTALAAIWLPVAMLAATVLPPAHKDEQHNGSGYFLHRCGPLIQMELEYARVFDGINRNMDA